MKTQFPVVIEHAGSFTFWSCLLPSFPAPFLVPCSTCIALLFNHFVHRGRVYCFLLVWQIFFTHPSKQDELDKATFFPHIFFQIMSRMLPQPSASSSSEENVHHFPSTVIGTCYWFSQIFHCRALNPLCLSPTCERKLLKGRAQGPFNQLYILCI